MLGRRGGPSVWAIALLVLAMTLGGCSGAATTVTGKTFFQRLGTGARKLYDRLINRKGNFPGLERKPPLTSLTDPANAQSDNPAISEAAKVKAEEDQAAQKIKAIKYLGTIGCGCHPDVRDALFAALDDCNADVRYAAAEAFETAANAICASCNTKSCCDREVLMKLWKMGYEKKAGSTCWLEPSARVRSAARRAFKACKQNCLPVPPPTDGPDEGPTATPAEAEGEGDATADASASGKPSGTQTAARSRGMEAAGGVFYLPGARYLAGKSNPTGGAQQAGEVVAGAPPRPTLADAPDPEASADDLNGEAIPPRPDGLGGPPMVAASNRSATPAPTGPVGPTASANAPASLDGPASQAGPASQNGPGANPAAYNNPGYNNNGYANNNAGYNANGYAGAPGYRGPNGDASAFGPPPGGVPGGQVAANLNAPAQPIQEPRLTAEQLESRRRALQAAVYNQQVEAELARQQESQAAQERQAIAWKQEQERRELERLQRMAAQPRPTDLGAAAPNGQFAPTPNAPASLGPNPTGPTFPAGNSGGMPTLVAPGGPLNTVAAPQTQFTSQQNPAASSPAQRTPLDPNSQARLEQETAARDRMLRERAAAMEAARQREIVTQTQRTPESDREARERWIREHEEADRAERERAARLQEARQRIGSTGMNEPGAGGWPERTPATNASSATGAAAAPPWQQGKISGVNVAGGSLEVVFPKTAPASLLGKQVDVFQRLDGRWVLMGKAEVVGVQGEGVVARPVGLLNLQQVTTNDYVFYRVNGSAEPQR